MALPTVITRASICGCIFWRLWHCDDFSTARTKSHTWQRLWLHHCCASCATIELATACAKCMQKGALCHSAQPDKRGNYFVTTPSSRNQAAHIVRHELLCVTKSKSCSSAAIGTPPAPRKCPVLTLVGPELVVLSTGFPYVDAGAIARSGDGKRDLSDAIASQGNTSQ